MYLVVTYSMLCDEHDGLVNFGPTFGQVETDIMYNQSDANQFQDGCQYLHTGEQYWIQFTNRQFIDHYKGSSMFIVFIQKVEKGDNNGFYFMYIDHYDQNVLLYTCTEPPIEFLEIVYSYVIPLHDSDVPVIFDYEIHSEDVLQGSRVTYDYFMKECHFQHYYGLSYTEYLQNVIEELIIIQEKVMDTAPREVLQDNGYLPPDGKLHIVNGLAENQHADDVVPSTSVICHNSRF